MNEELRFLSIAAAGAAMRRGAFSPLDLVQAHLAAIEEQNDRLGAYLTVTADRALQTASACRLATPLAGIPFGVKDNIDTAGIRTTSASRLLADNVPDRDADVVAALDRADAALLGKLNTYEFGTGTGAVYPDLDFPIARNPWDHQRFSGGSSTGAGVAVAAGLAMFAIGTDTGGSVRLPAAACGVVGLKPTFGAISRLGMQPNCRSLDHVGVLARTVDDVATVFGAIRGSAATAPSPPTLRVGIIERFHEYHVECDADIVRGLRQAADIFRALGATVIPLDLPYNVLDYRACSRILNVSECFAIHERSFNERRMEMGAALRDKLLAGSLMSASDYIRGVRWRSLLATAVDRLFDHCDIVLCLGAPTVAPPLSDIRRVTAFTTSSAMAVFNVSGHPALSICCGLDPAGMPLNVQLAAPVHAEDRLLSAAKRFETARGLLAAPSCSGSARTTPSPPVQPPGEAAAKIEQRAANDAAVARMPRYLAETVELSCAFAIPR